jgi:catechol 2,3-dioxygenase-like lactoylglutathione lyase family enzyme
VNGQIELVLLPVADVDRAKEFYVERCGFQLLVDHAPNEHFRVVQCQPEGSACAIAFGTALGIDNAPGSVRGTHIMVTDIVAARDELVARGVEVQPIFSFSAQGEQSDGPHPERADYGSFAQFADPDGNTWLLQERGFAG